MDMRDNMVSFVAPDRKRNTIFAAYPTSYFHQFKRSAQKFGYLWWEMKNIFKHAHILVAPDGKAKQLVSVVFILLPASFDFGRETGGKVVAESIETIKNGSNAHLFLE